MYENEITVTMQIKVKVRVDSYTTDEDSMESVYAEAEEIAMNSIEIGCSCSLKEKEVLDVELCDTNYHSVAMVEAA